MRILLEYNTRQAEIATARKLIVFVSIVAGLVGLIIQLDPAHPKSYLAGIFFFGLGLVFLVAGKSFLSLVFRNQGTTVTWLDDKITISGDVDHKTFNINDFGFFTFDTLGLPNGTVTVRGKNDRNQILATIPSPKIFKEQVRRIMLDHYKTQEEEWWTPETKTQQDAQAVKYKLRSVVKKNMIWGLIIITGFIIFNSYSNCLAAAESQQAQWHIMKNSIPDLTVEEFEDRFLLKIFEDSSVCQTMTNFGIIEIDYARK